MTNIVTRTKRRSTWAGVGVLVTLVLVAAVGYLAVTQVPLLASKYAARKVVTMLPPIAEAPQPPIVVVVPEQKEEPKVAEQPKTQPPTPAPAPAPVKTEPPKTKPTKVPTAVVTVKAATPVVIEPVRQKPETVVRAPLFRWRNVGGDPCNPKAGCTLEWALQQTGWPAEVQADFRQEVRYGHPAQTQVCSGWIGWMTWGKYERKFKPHVLADWPSGHCEPALHWSVAHTTGEYELVKVNKCGNWGGRKGRAMEREIVPSWLGTIPVAACPD